MTKHIIGGTPNGRGDALVKTDTAVLLDAVSVVMLDGTGTRGQGPIVGLELAGRINQKQARSDVLYLTDADGIASIVTELLALAERQGRDYSALVHARIKTRADQLARETGARR